MVKLPKMSKEDSDEIEAIPFEKPEGANVEFSGAAAVEENQEAVDQPSTTPRLAATTCYAAPLAEDETDIIMEAVGKIREILRPLKDYQQQTALAVAKELETHARVLQSKARSDRRFGVFESLHPSMFVSESPLPPVGQ